MLNKAIEIANRDGQNYEQFIDRVLTNETACYVKLADLDDNMDLTRIKNPTEKDHKRIQKYNKAVELILTGMKRILNF